MLTRSLAPAVGQYRPPRRQRIDSRPRPRGPARAPAAVPPSARAGAHVYWQGPGKVRNRHNLRLCRRPMHHNLPVPVPVPVLVPVPVPVPVP